MKFEVIAGDFPKKTEFVQSKEGPKLKYPGSNQVFGFAYNEVSLAGNIERIEIVTEENKKRILGSTAWGITGAVLGSFIAAPVALAAGIAGILKGGNKKEICFACYLKDGRKFMAIAEAKAYTQIISLSF